MMRWRWFGLLLLTGSWAGAEEPGTEVRLAIVVSRHGINASKSNPATAAYAAQAWPAPGGPAEHLTPHGEQLIAHLGAFYRALYVQRGVLSGETATDLARIYFRADSDPRTLETARDLAKGLLPGASPAVASLREKKTDPLFRPNLILADRPDYALARAAVLGRIGGSPEAVVIAHRDLFEALQRVMLGADGTMPAGKVLILSQPPRVGPQLASHIVSLGGSLRTGMVLTDALLSEYVDAQPMAQVGWGRVSAAQLPQLLELHALYDDLTQRTFYPAQVQGSNLAFHLLRTLEQAAEARANPDALGGPGHRLLVVVGHDTNLANLGGLMGLSWIIPGGPMNPTLHGSALLFELLHRPDGRFEVRASYLAQTMEQMRASSVPTLAAPPAIVPVFVPGCSGSGPTYAAPLAAFAARVRELIDPRFVLPDTLN